MRYRRVRERQDYLYSKSWSGKGQRVMFTRHRWSNRDNWGSEHAYNQLETWWLSSDSSYTSLKSIWSLLRVSMHCNVKPLRMGPPGHKKLPGMQVHYIYHIHKDMGPHVIIFQFRCVQSHYHTHIKSSTWPCSRPLQAFCERIAQSKELHEFDHGTVTVSSKVFPSSLCDQQSAVLLETRRLYSRNHSKSATKRQTA